jgi:hypothetical protein
MDPSTIPPMVFSAAVSEFWQTRQRQKARGSSVDQGSRSAVTGGKQMNGFVQKIVELMVSVGVQKSNIHFEQSVTPLPGFFRPTKRWDLLVVTEGHLLAAIELRSHVGSFGNNFNNRTEEAMGSALDLWTAYREGAFRTSPQPWLGYLLLLENSAKSQRPVKVDEPHFPVLPEFRDASYAGRYELFCRRLVLERHYSAACFLMADAQEAALPGNYTEPAEDLSATRFLSQLLRHVQQ